MSIPGKFPLQYRGVDATNPPNFYVFDRNPTTSDYQNFVIGDIWLNQVKVGGNPPTYSTSKTWQLAAKAQNIGTWIELTNGSLTITLPDHSVALGTGSVGLNSTSPNATLGQPLVSHGINSDPSFGTASVSGGGTGLDAIPQYAVVCGGISGEGPLQTVSGLGTASQVLTSNGAGLLPTWQPGGGTGGNGGPIAVQVLTSTGTYTPTSGMASCFVEIIGGGGGGGDIVAGIGAAGGGASGGYCRKFFLASDIGSSQSVTIGAGGIHSGNGGNTTFGSLLTAEGGGQGTDGSGGLGGAGGTASGGDINIQGAYGGTAGSENGSTNFNVSGFGGGNLYGAGGLGLLDNSDLAGIDGSAYGSGGSGAVRVTTGNSNGGAGFAGVCIVTEFGPYAPTPPGAPFTLNTIILDTPGADTYTPSVGMFQCVIECVGGGGGGFGATWLQAAPYTTPQGTSAFGGAYCKKLYDAASIGASQPVVIGAGGAAGIAGDLGVSSPTYFPGDNGGDTTFGSGDILITAQGGQNDSQISFPLSYRANGIGGDINIMGGAPSLSPINAAFQGLSGQGAVYGTVGIVSSLGRNDIAILGVPGTLYGGGACSLAGFGGFIPPQPTVMQDGAPGGSGVIIITEYIA